MPFLVQLARAKSHDKVSVDDIFAGGALEFFNSLFHNKQRPLLANHRQSALTLVNPDATDDFEPWSRPTFLTLPKTIITRAPRAAAMMR